MVKVDFVEGEVLLLNKSYEWTSFDLVNKVRIMLRNNLGIKKIKVGHAGTLDPLATGLMIVCTGKATKKIDSLSGLDKEYIATIHIGATTPTYDLESLINEEFPIEHITVELIDSIIQSFKGSIQQTPPIFSAIRVNGRKAYDLARRGHEVELKSREITINEIEIIKWDKPNLVLRVSCSKGTYIRSLANDIGKALNSGAHLAGLERTRIGTFSLADAMDLDNLQRNLQSLATK
jgi:tRNA pseudouridine55 synthase